MRDVTETVDVTRSLKEEVVEVVVEMVGPVFDDLVGDGGPMLGRRRVERADRMIEVEDLAAPDERRRVENATLRQEVQRPEVVGGPEQPPG